MFPAIPSIALVGLWFKQAGSFLFGNWRTILISIAVVVVFWLTVVVMFLWSSTKRLEADNQRQFVEIINSREAYHKLKEAADASIAAIVAERDSAVARTQAAQERERSILNEPDENDGPVSPSLRRSIERLRQ